MLKLIKSLLAKKGLFSTLSIGITLLLLLLPSSGSTKAMLFPHFDKIAHIAVFGACAFFLYIDLRIGHKISKKALLNQVIIFIIGVAIGYAVELIQDAYLGREYSLQDVIADAIGLFLGLKIAQKIYPVLMQKTLSQ